MSKAVNQAVNHCWQETASCFLKLDMEKHTTEPELGLAR
jgi:hypothetical protein